VKFKQGTEFQETEIGKIPREWKVVKLKDIATKIKMGGTPKRSVKEYWDGDIPFARIEDITKSRKYLLSTSSTITKLGLENSNAWLVPIDSLLITIYGTLGAVAINKVEVATNQAIVGVVPKRELVDVEFLYYWYLYYQPNWINFVKKSTQPNLTLEIVANSKIPLPSISEQERIVKILSTVDRTIESVDATVTRLEGLKKVLMSELLTGRVRVREEKGKVVFYRETEFQETEIGKIPRGWSVMRLGSLIEMDHGERPKILEEGSIPVYGGGGLYGYTNSYLVDKPYVLVLARVGKGSVGKVYLARGKVWITDNAIYGHSRDLEGITTVYAYYWLLFDKTWTERYVRRSAGGYAIITLDSLKNLKMPFPPLNEQKRIYEILSTMDKAIELYYEEKTRLNRLKRGLMDLLLTGKVRVVG
jgi:type I restriction enzyme S subunit